MKKSRRRSALRWNDKAVPVNVPATATGPIALCPALCPALCLALCLAQCLVPRPALQCLRLCPDLHLHRLLS